MSEKKKLSPEVEASRIDANKIYPRVEFFLEDYFDEVVRNDNAQWYGKSGFCVLCYHKERDFSLRITYSDKRFQIEARKGHYIVNDRNVFVQEYQDNLLIIKFTDYMKMKNEYTADRCFETFIKKLMLIYGAD